MVYAIDDPRLIAEIENGVPLAVLEERLRPGKVGARDSIDTWSDQSSKGFIGADEELVPLIYSDWQTVEAAGTTHTDIANGVRGLFSVWHKNRVAKWWKNRNYRANVASVEKNGFIYVESGIFTAGSQSCPWGCSRIGNNSGYIIRPDPDMDMDKVRMNMELLTAGFARDMMEKHMPENDLRELDQLRERQQSNDPLYATLSTLLPHLIEEHHFFEGKGTPYRADPAILIPALGLASCVIPKLVPVTKLVPFCEFVPYFLWCFVL
ncbi:MAG: hypothetical protein KKG59_04565 [Nanoarchaeota archaeon]|nr:hypothetical protein [Nanoarchaeota archaeon]